MAWLLIGVVLVAAYIGVAAGTYRLFSVPRDWRAAAHRIANPLDVGEGR